MDATEIRALARLIDRMDYYRLLRADPKSPPSKIRAAYRTARRQFHPDAFIGAERRIQAAVDRIARRINEAYLVLRDSHKRASYDHGLTEGKLRYSPETGKDAPFDAGAVRSRTPNGRRFLALALAEERASNLGKAIAHLKMALTFDRDNESLQQKLKALQATLKG